MIGGFLMAVSAVGVFGAYTNATATPDTSYVVARRDVPAGERLAAADVDLVPLDLPPEQSGVSYADPDLLLGATTLAPLQAGQLIASGQVARPRGGDGRAQISLAVPPGNALNGAVRYLRPGELVDVIATFTEGSVPETRTVSRSAVVVEAFAGGDVLGGSGAVTIVVAVPPVDLEPIAQASAVADVSIARTTGLDRPDPPPTTAAAVAPAFPSGPGADPEVPGPDLPPVGSGPAEQQG